MSAPTREPVERVLANDLPFPPEVFAALRTLNGSDAYAVDIIAREMLGPDVHRLNAVIDGVPRSLVIKASDPWMANRNRLVAERWLPAVGMAENGPPLLACVAERDGERVWQLYEDLGDCCLDEAAPDRERVTLAAELLARMHARFAEHPLLAECRLWGGDYGIGFYSANVRDAIRCLEELRAPVIELSAEEVAVHERLLQRMYALREEEPTRARMLEQHGGPETLVHGDLWPKNVLVRREAHGLRAQLIDWDRVGVGHASYDLSTFLSRFPAEDRGWVLDSYRGAAERIGWPVPNTRELNALAATAELSRLTNRVIWPALALLEGHPERDWAIGELATFADWIDGIEPLFSEG